MRTSRSIVSVSGTAISVGRPASRSWSIELSFAAEASVAARMISHAPRSRPVGAHDHGRFGGQPAARTAQEGVFSRRSALVDSRGEL